MSWNHYFDEDVAKEYGVESAIVIEHLRGWIRKAKASGRNFFDGRYWTYNSTKAWAELLPFWTDRQVGRILTSLIVHGVLITGRFNKKGYDRTLWYAFKDDKWISSNGKMHSPEPVNGTSETGEPIPSPPPSSLPTEKGAAQEAACYDKPSPRDVTDLYWTAHEKRYGMKPQWKAQYADFSKRLLCNSPLPFIDSCIRAYFDDSKRFWFCKDGRRDFGKFFQHFDEIATSLAQKTMQEPKAKVIPTEDGGDWRTL